MIRRYLFKKTNNIMSSKVIKYTTIIGIIIILVAIVFIPKLLQSEKKPNNAKVEQANLRVQIQIVQREIIEDKLVLSGTLSPFEEVEIKPEISGRVTSINFTEGGNTQKGNILVKLNDSDLRAEFLRAKERIKLLESIESRQKQLLDKKGISLEEYEISLNELNMQRATVSYIQAMIDKTEIRAPFSGILGIREISNGAIVSPEKVITTLQVIDRLRLDFTIPQRYATEIKAGQNVQFKVPPSDKVHTAKVYVIEPRIDRSTRTVRLRAEYKNTDRIFPGTYVEVELIKDTKEELFMIPTQALIPDLDSDKVYVYENGEAVIRNVSSGFRNETHVSITNGLQAGDSLITSGIMMLRPGMKVDISNI